MKIIIIAKSLIIFFLLFQDAPISSVANINIPSKAEKLNAVTLKKYVGKNFYANKSFKRIKNTYKVGNILIGFEDFIVNNNDSRSINEIKDDMSAEGEELIAMGKKVTLETINNRQFIICKSILSNECYYTFYSDFKNKKGISGAVLFKTKDKKNGEKVFDELIKNISFKN